MKHQKLNRLLRDLSTQGPTPCDIWKQRVSFVFGQMMDCIPGITYEEVEQRATEIYGPCPAEDTND